MRRKFNFKPNIRVTRRQLLVGATASVFMGACRSALFPSRIKETFDVKFKDKYFIQATDVAASNDGGYFVSATDRIIKLDRSGNTQWLYRSNATGLNHREKIYGLCAAGDGGVLAVGNTTSLDLLGPEWANGIPIGDPRRFPDTAFVVKLNEFGNIVWRKACGPVKNGDASYFHRVIRSGDGFVLFGEKISPLPANAPPAERPSEIYPWIVGINSQGEIEWDFLIKKEGDRFIRAAGIIQIYGNPIVDKDGNIIVPIAIEDIRLMKGESGNVELDTLIQGTHERALVVKITPQGRILTQFVPSDNYFPVIVNHGRNYIFYARLLDSVLRIEMNADLQEIQRSNMPAEDFIPSFAAVSKNGCTVLLGETIHPKDDAGPATMYQVTPDNKLVKIATLGFGFFSNTSIANGLCVGRENCFAVLWADDDNIVHLSEFA